MSNTISIDDRVATYPSPGSPWWVTTQGPGTVIGTEPATPGNADLYMCGHGPLITVRLDSGRTRIFGLSQVRAIES